MSQTEALLRALLNIFPSNLRHEMVHLSTFVSWNLDLGIVQLRDLVWATKANIAGLPRQTNRDGIDCTLPKVCAFDMRLGN